MVMKAYIFDFDGTLVDSMPTWSLKMIRILEHYGVSYPKDVIRRITPLGDIGTAKYFREELGVPATEEELFAQMDAFALPKYRDEIPIKAGVENYLRGLKAQGASLHVLTASPHKMADPCLKRLGIFDLFENVWSSDDFGMTKSQPEIYKEAARRIGVTVEEAVFFDDNIGALQTAKAAGMYTVGVYDASGEDFMRQMKETADLYINSFEEMELSL